MNANKTLIALAVLAASTCSAFAAGGGEITQDTAPIASTRTRAEVRAEAMQARAAGTIVSGEMNGNGVVVMHSERTREEVRAEARQALANHTVTRGGEISSL